MDTTDFHKYLSDAKTRLADNDPKGAALQLRFAAQAFDAMADDQRLVALAEILSHIGGHMGLAELEDSASAAMGLGPQELFDIGFELLEVGLPNLAIPFLQRLNVDVPGDENVVQELAVALEREGRNAEARDLLLENSQLLVGFWPLYLVCFNALSAGDINTAKAHCPTLVPTGDDEQAATSRIQAMLARTDDVQSDLSDQDLRGWHYVINGSVLLHLSPYGHDEGMNGRYAYSQDSAEGIRRDLERMVAVLRAMEVQPTLLYPPDRSSAIIAQALGELARLPVQAYAPGVDGMVVAYDLAEVPDTTLQAIADASPRPRIFTRGACWTQPPALVPDFVGLLHQHLVAPWGERLAVGSEGKAEQVPASTAPVSTWAETITSASPDVDDETTVTDSLEQVLDLAKHLEAPSDCWFDGPVKSSRFL